MSDETEDGPEVQEIYEKLTGYAIGHFPAHTTPEEDIDDVEEEDNAEEDDDADLWGETPVPPTPIVQSCQPRCPNPVMESEFLVARKTWQGQKGGKSNVIVL